jgi:hypothetical protein
MEEKMNKTHEPDRLFLDRLEWQLSSEYRRTNRLEPASRKVILPRKLVAVALVIGVLMTGVAVTKAADYIKDSWRKKIEIARVETEVQLKKLRLESMRERASDIKMRVSNGLIREEEYQALKLAVENTELDLKRSLLNREEVEMSGEIPRDELYAPMVGGRDFVSERLMIETKEAELRIRQLGIQQARIKQLVEEKVVRGEELHQIQAAINDQKVMLDKIQQQIELRARFLARKITAKEVEIEERMTEAEKNLQLSRSKVESLETQLERLQTLEAQGSISSTEVLQFQHALDAARAELKLATLEMEVLEKIR